MISFSQTLLEILGTSALNMVLLHLEPWNNRVTKYPWISMSKNINNRFSQTTCLTRWFRGNIALDPGASPSPEEMTVSARVLRIV
jgi:hypothetical protein